MSTNTPPRQREVAVTAVSKLRADDALADEIYQDTTTPTNPSNRQRIYLGNIADKREGGATVAVLPIATGSTSPKAGVYTKSYLTQVSVDYSESYYERRGTLSMYAARDRADDVFSDGARDLYPTGPEGGDSIEIDADGYRTLTNRFRVVAIE